MLVLYTRREFEEIICRIVDDASKRAEGLVLSSASSFRSSEGGISVKLIIKTLNRLQTLSDPAFQIWGISTAGFPRVFEDLDERRGRCVKSLGEVLRNYASTEPVERIALSPQVSGSLTSTSYIFYESVQKTPADFVFHRGDELTRCVSNRATYNWMELRTTTATSLVHNNLMQHLTSSFLTFQETTLRLFQQRKDGDLAASSDISGNKKLFIAALMETQLNVEKDCRPLNSTVSDLTQMDHFPTV